MLRRRPIGVSTCLQSDSSCLTLFAYSLCSALHITKIYANELYDLMPMGNRKEKQTVVYRYICFSIGVDKNLRFLLPIHLTPNYLESDFLARKLNYPQKSFSHFIYNYDLRNSLPL